MKRFWTNATIRHDTAAATILLDGKPLRFSSTPASGAAVLTLPPGPLAEAIAAEWQAAGGAPGGAFTPDDLPLTRLAGTAYQRIAADPGPTADAIARYAETDLLCYRAASPPELAARQAMLWQPWLDWSTDTLGAPLIAHAGVMPHPQPPQSLARLRGSLAAASPARLAGLGVIVPALGSLVLGLAVAERQLDPDSAHELALLDELFETSLWGVDADAAARREHIRRDIADAARFMVLASQGS